MKELSIPIAPNVCLRIYSSKEDVHQKDDASDWGESCWQLEEGKQYDYEFIEKTTSKLVDDWFLDGDGAILTPNPIHDYRGKITTGIYVGTTTFTAKRKGSTDSVSVELEIRSVKTNYREQYRHMLTDITKWYTDLVMIQGSPVTQKFEIDPNAPSETLYQRFAFLKNLVETRQFHESIHMIISNPVRRWNYSVTEKRIEAVRRISRSSLKQLATRTNRIAYHDAAFPLDSLPRYITVDNKIDSVDTSENQFIKYVLVYFYSFCVSLSSKNNASDRLKNEARAVCNRLTGYLHNTFFKDVSLPTRLNLGSPVLQRKEGYREILQAWLMFSLSSKIVWKGSNNVFSGGKKNVAALYEYWIFFELLECVSSVFSINHAEKSKLVSSDDDNINLSLCQGKTEMISGQTQRGNRKLNVRLYYNRTYTHNSKLDEAGSWTMNMRPDYTLAIWPGDITEKEAEKSDTIVYIHFDAKYRLNRILIEDENKDDNALEQDFLEEKQNREIDIYKRGDLLKMHAYKDAIRRTSGAYIIYPGDASASKKVSRGFKEIIPGLGAFPIAPGHEDEQLPALKEFLEDIVSHFLNRISQREKIALSSHVIHKEDELSFYEPFPEPFGFGDFPDSVKVLVCDSNNKCLNWIATNNKYPLCFKKGEGLSKSYLEARYILLYKKSRKNDDITVDRIMKISGTVPVITSNIQLKSMGYPGRVSNSFYLVYDLLDNIEDEIKNREWAIQSLVKDHLYKPFVVTYYNLFELSL